MKTLTRFFQGVLMAGIFALPVASQALETLTCGSSAFVINTAYASDTTFKPVGSRDTNWQAGFGSLAGGPSTVQSWVPAYVVGQIAGAWATSPFSNADWIAVDAISSAPNSPTSAFFRYDFVLDPAINPAKFALSLDFYADNSVNAVYVNGVQRAVPGVPQSLNDPDNHVGFTSSARAVTTINTGWVTGNNSLVLNVRSAYWDRAALGFLAQSRTSVLCEPPQVTVSAVSLGGAATFDYSGTNGFAATSITTAVSGTAVAGSAKVLSVSKTATTITQAAPPAGWELAAISCTGMGAGGTATPTINGAAGGSVLLDTLATDVQKDIACTFRNIRLSVLTKAYSPATFSSGGSTNVVLTLTNPTGSAATTAGFTDTLPSSVVVASTPAIGGTCTNVGSPGVVAAAPGGKTIVVTGMAVPPGASCTVTVAVTNVAGATNANCAANPGAFSNTAANISNTSGVTMGSAGTPGTTACVVIPPASASNSGVRVINDRQLADGTAAVRLEAMIRDAAGAPVGGQTVNFAATAGVSAGASTGAAIGAAASCVTAATGICEINTRSALPGTKSTAVTLAGSALSGSFTAGGNAFSVSPAAYTFVQSNLRLTISPASPALSAGGISTVTATLTNVGDSPANGGAAKIQLPPGMTFEGATATGWTCAAPVSNLVSCIFAGVVPAGGLTELPLRLKPDASSGGKNMTVSYSVGPDALQTPAPEGCTDSVHCVASAYTVGSGVSMSIQVSAPAPSLAVGANSAYGVTVTNNGTAPARTGQVKTQLPAGMDYVSAAGTGWTCAADAARLVTCDQVSDIAVGASNVISVTVKPALSLNGKAVAVDASVGKGGENAPQPGSASGCTDTAACARSPDATVDAGVDLLITLSTPAPALAVGVDSGYTLTVTNKGTGPAAAAQAKVQLPPELEFRSGVGSGWACTANASNLVTCDFTGTIAAGGGSTSAALTVRPKAGSGSTVVAPPASVGKTNGAAPAPGPSCTDAAACTTAPSATVGNGVSLGISITGPSPALAVGADSAYAVAVINNGTGAATQAQVKVQVPAGVDYRSAAGSGWICAANATNLVTCDYSGSIAPGATSNLTLTVRPTTASAGTTVAPSASVGKTNTTAPAPGASCTDTTACATASPAAVGNGVSLAISLSAPAPALGVGVDSIHTLTVTNNGTGPASTAQAKVQLPPELEFRSGVGSGWACTANASNLATCDFTGTIAAGGGSTSAALTVRPKAGSGSTVVAPPASVGKTNGAAPAPGPSCTDTAACTTAPAATVGNGVSLGISITGPSPALAVGADSAYAVAVINNGTGAATQAQVKVQVPPGVDYRSAAGSGWMCAANATNLVTCDYSGSIAPGATSNLTLTVRPTTASAGTTVAPSASVGKTNTAAPAPGASCTDTTACATASPATVGNGVSLAISLSAPAPALKVGVDSIHTLTVTNNGTGPASEAHTKVQLPPELEFRSGVGTGWACTANASNLVSCDFTGTIAAGGGSTSAALTVRPRAGSGAVVTTVYASVGKTNGAAPAPGPSCTDTAACTTAPSATVGNGVSLGISITGPSPALAVGADSAYAVAVINNGTGAATQAQVKVQVPPGVDYRSATGSGWVCAANATNLVTCDYSGSIAPGATSNLTLTVRPTTASAGTTVAPSASVGKTNTTAPAPGASCTDTTACATASPAAVGNGVSLAISLSAPAPALKVGVDSIHTLTVTNNGTGPAAEAHTKVQLPPELEFRSGVGTGWVCTASASNLVTCDFTGTIAAGGGSTSAALTVRPRAGSGSTVVAPPASVGKTNGAAPAPGPSCTDTAACTTAPTATVGNGVLLSIKLSGPSPALTVGMDSVHTLTVTNSGTGSASEAHTKVQLPAGLEFRSGVGSGWVCTADSANLVACDFTGTITALGGSTSVALTVRPKAGSGGTVTALPASVGRGNGAAPLPGASCTDAAACVTSSSATVNSGVALSVTVDGPSPVLVVGVESTYTVNVANNGTGATKAAQVKAQLPEGMTFNGATGAGWRCIADAANLVSCEFAGSIEPAARSTLELRATPKPALADKTVTVPVSVGKGADTPAPTPGTTCTDTTTCASSLPARVGKGVVLKVTISAPDPALAVGTESAYTVTVTNTGTAPATSAQAKVQLPPGMDYRGGSGANWVCKIDTTNLVTCDFSGGEILPKGAVSVITSTVAPTGILSGISVVAPASVGGDGGDAPAPGPLCVDPGTCATSPPSVVSGGVGLSLLKTTAKKQVSIGDVVAYTITVGHPGNGIARGVTIDDRLPTGFRFIPGTLTLRQGSGAAMTQPNPTGSPGPRLTITVGDLQGGSRAEVSYRARVGIGAQRGTGINSAKAQSTNGLSSGVARATVEVTGGVFSSDACILGKVYTDCDGNGVQNGSQDVGIPQARVYLEDGTNITTDVNGNFSICGMRPTTHVMRVDPSSLPAGAKPLPTSNRNAGDPRSLFVDLKNGELHRADFAVQACTPAQRDDIGKRAEALEKAQNDPKRRPDFGLRFESDSNLRRQSGPGR